jgi:hypothetical protein
VAPAPQLGAQRGVLLLQLGDDALLAIGRGCQRVLLGRDDRAVLGADAPKRGARTDVEQPQRIRAQQREVAGVRQLVEEVLDRERRERVAGRAQQRHHLPVDANVPAASRSAVDDRADGGHEALAIGFAARHEVPQQLVRVERLVVALQLRDVEVDPAPPDRGGERLAVLGRRDDDDGLAVAHGGGEEVGDGLDEKPVGLVELDEVVVARRPLHFSGSTSRAPACQQIRQVSGARARREPDERPIAAPSGPDEGLGGRSVLRAWSASTGIWRAAVPGALPASLRSRRGVPAARHAVEIRHLGDAIAKTPLAAGNT